MTDAQKTTTYVVLGALALLIGFEPWKGRSQEASLEEQGQKLFPDFDNALSATSLEVVDFDEDTSAIKPFKVARVDGIWSIPSHQNYPADAREHLAAAATTLIDLDILGVAGSSPGEHEVFGVLEPDINTLKAGATGVGRRVMMKDAKDNSLADLIIGKEVKDQPGVRYVRRTGKDPVYRVAIKTDKLSTKFDDWIEKDLLKLNTFDLREIDLNDYSLKQGRTQEGEIGISQVKAGEINLLYDDEKSTWSVKDFIEYQKNKPVSTKLADDEELNTEKLNALRSALDDLKIVDVERKPKGLNADLTIAEDVAQEGAALQELANSLVVRGFVPVPASESKISLLSSEGEAVCKLKNGVEYIVRFGQVAGSSDHGEKQEAGQKEKKDETAGLNRYVMITAQLDTAMIPKPELEAIPETPAEKPVAETPENAEAKPADKKAPVPKLGDRTPEDKKDEDKKPEEPQAEEKQAEDEAAKKAADEEKRAAIEKENNRKQDEYDEKVNKAEEKVKELNDRFADWYYVISDDVYKKIHLTRADVVKKKETKPDEGDTIGDFKELDKGLTPPKAP